MAGRPGRSGGIKFTPTVRNNIIQALAAGCNRRQAAILTGLHPETLSRWLSRTEPMFVNFAQAVAKAEAIAEARALRVVRQAGLTDWRAAVWWLEHRYPARWGKRRMIHLQDLDDEQLLCMIFEHENSVHVGQGAVNRPEFPGGSNL